MTTRPETRADSMNAVRFAQTHTPAGNQATQNLREPEIVRWMRIAAQPLDAVSNEKTTSTSSAALTLSAHPVASA